MQTQNCTYPAIGNRLSGVKGVHVLGLRPNFMDYSLEERTRILEAPLILDPTRNYAELFSTIGKRIFPSLETHLYSDDKIKQTTLFCLLGLPHPRTRFYFRGHQRNILRDFAFPFIAKLPRLSACGRGVFLIRDEDELNAYLQITPVAYIQELISHRRDLRVVLVNYEPVLAYWRVKDPANFRANLAQGGHIDFDGIPREAVELARWVALQCRLDDVGLDLIPNGDKWFVIEANMKYGRKALEQKGIDFKEIIRRNLVRGELGRPASSAL